MTDRKASLIDKRRVSLSPRAFAEFVIWKLPEVVGTGAHQYKYRLAYVVDNKCVVRYDNEITKGDHCHYGAIERPYQFQTLDQLVTDFFLDVERWNHENSYL